MVTAVSTENNSLVVQCIFVTGSTARGCKVVLVGQFDNTTLNLTRKGLIATATVSTGSLQAACITEVLGYDIESNGTVGILAIEANTTSACLPAKDSQGFSYQNQCAQKLYYRPPHCRLWHSYWNSFRCGSHGNGRIHPPVNFPLLFENKI